MSDRGTDKPQGDEGAGWLRCYVEGCEEEVTEKLRLHVRSAATQEVLACATHAAILRIIAL